MAQDMSDRLTEESFEEKTAVEPSVEEAPKEEVGVEKEVPQEAPQEVVEALVEKAPEKVEEVVENVVEEAPVVEEEKEDDEVDQEPVVEENPVEGKPEPQTSEFSRKDFEWMFNDGLVSVGLFLPERGKEMFKKLALQRRVQTSIPYALKETKRKNNPKEIIISGLKFVIPKNTLVELPESVFQIAMESLDTGGLSEIPNSHGESLQISSADKAAEWFGLD